MRFLLGGVCILRDVVRILCIFFFSFYVRYIVQCSCTLDLVIIL